MIRTRPTLDYPYSSTSIFNLYKEYFVLIIKILSFISNFSTLIILYISSFISRFFSLISGTRVPPSFPTTPSLSPPPLSPVTTPLHDALAFIGQTLQMSDNAEFTGYATVAEDIAYPLQLSHTVNATAVSFEGRRCGQSYNFGNSEKRN